MWHFKTKILTAFIVGLEMTGKEAYTYVDQIPAIPKICELQKIIHMCIPLSIN